MPKIDCILFDLDGTLLDTSYDFAYALNLTCQQFQVPPVSYNDLRGIISQGGQAMVEMAFPELAKQQATSKDAKIDLNHKKQVFLDFYFNNIALHTAIFPGLEKAMQTIATQNIPWGIVTNKPARLTKALLAQIAFPSPPKTIICGDTLTVNKPDPAPMLQAAKECLTQPENCLYLGDHPRDIEAGKNANMQTGAALFGYLTNNATTNGWNADYLFHSPIEISQFIILNTDRS